MTSKPDATNFENIRWVLGAVCLVAAWLFPFYSVASRDAMQQMFALGMLGLASLLFGMSAIASLPLLLLAAAILVMASAPHVYWGGQIAGVAGLLLAGVAAHVGAQSHRKPALLPWLLLGIVIAAFCNAAEGLLQWFGLVPGLSPWVIEPERRGIAFGAFRQPNLFATFICVGAVSALWLVELRRLTETMAWFLLVVLVFAVAASGSRSGAIELLALAVAGCVWLSPLYDQATTTLYTYERPGGIETVDHTMALKLWRGARSSDKSPARSYPGRKDLEQFGRDVCGVRTPSAVIEQLSAGMDQALHLARHQASIPPALCQRYVEAMNGLLQQAKRAARGFRTAANFIAIAYLRMSKLKHLPANPLLPAMPQAGVLIHRCA